MIYNEDTYYVGYHRNVRTLKAVPALVFDTIVGLLRDPNNRTGEVANKTLQDILGVSKQTIIDAINKLIDVGYIVRTNGDGRGNKSVYIITEKGIKNIPFIEKKGSNNWTERVQEIDLKGQENRPINKELNTELKGGVPPTPEKVMSKDFLLFWDLYGASPEYDHDKQHCSDVWDRIDPDWQQKLLQQVRMNLRWRNKPNDKPYYYLLDYRGQDVQVELPIMRQGTTKCAKWLQDAQEKGDKICLMFEGEGDQQHVVYCLAKDRTICEAAGLRFCRDM